MAASTDYLTSGSGIGNVYVNAKWLFKISGLYQLPYDFNVSAFYNARQGYPFEQGILSPSRLNGAGHGVHRAGPDRRPASAELPEPRLPLRASRSHDEHPVHPVAGRVQRVELEHNPGDPRHPEHRDRHDTWNANQIQAIVAPRVVRFGVRVNW